MNTEKMWGERCDLRGKVRRSEEIHSPEEARTSGEAAYARPVSDEVVYVDEAMTLADLNHRELKPGMKVLFKRGGVW